MCLACQDNQVKEGKAWILKKTMFDWQKQFWREEQGKGKQVGEPWFTLKGLLQNLNMINVVFASPPTVLPRWDSLGRVFNMDSHWRALGLTLMGADVCLLLCVPITSHHVATRAGVGRGLSSPMKPSKGSNNFSFLLHFPQVSSPPLGKAGFVRITSFAGKILHCLKSRTLRRNNNQPILFQHLQWEKLVALRQLIDTKA